MALSGRHRSRGGARNGHADRRWRARCSRRLLDGYRGVVGLGRGRKSRL